MDAPEADLEGLGVEKGIEGSLDLGGWVGGWVVRSFTTGMGRWVEEEAKPT